MAEYDKGVLRSRRKANEIRRLADLIDTAATRVEAGEDASIVITHGIPWTGSRDLPFWNYWLDSYSLAPKRTLRPWTAEEAAKHKRRRVMLAGSSNEWRITGVIFGNGSEDTVMLEPISIGNSYREVPLSEMTRYSLSGFDSPCGVMEEVKG